jgi:hypothetical protein
MKSAAIIIVAVMTGWIPIYGMATPPKDEIPIPQENFHARIIDTDNIETPGEEIAIDSRTYFAAKRGESDVYIPFERIKSIKLNNAEDSKVIFEITLMDGTSSELTADARKELTGKASFGQFKLKLGHLKSLEFLSHTPNPTATPRKPN